MEQAYPSACANFAGKHCLFRLGLEGGFAERFLSASSF